MVEVEADVGMVSVLLIIHWSDTYVSISSMCIQIFRGACRDLYLLRL